jgi:acyl-CoA synthetase (AMP-forming)/AMP-acid ligase II
LRIASGNRIGEKQRNPDKIRQLEQHLRGCEMGPAFFVIAILGCADGGTSCTPVTTLQTHYATEAECTDAAGAALIENSQFDFPTLLARCRPEQAKSADAITPRPEKHRRG